MIAQADSFVKPPPFTCNAGLAFLMPPTLALGEEAPARPLAAEDAHLAYQGASARSTTGRPIGSCHPCANVPHRGWKRMAVVGGGTTTGSRQPCANVPKPSAAWLAASCRGCAE
jgi:hypothetical protein